MPCCDPHQYTQYTRAPKITYCKDLRWHPVILTIRTELPQSANSRRPCPTAVYVFVIISSTPRETQAKRPPESFRIREKQSMTSLWLPLAPELRALTAHVNTWFPLHFNTVSSCHHSPR
jgi:hypothetical protein